MSENDRGQKVTLPSGQTVDVVSYPIRRQFGPRISEGPLDWIIRRMAALHEAADFRRPAEQVSERTPEPVLIGYIGRHLDTVSA